MNIPITNTSALMAEFGPEIEGLVHEAISTGRLAQGPLVERTEAEFASMHGVDHARMVNNGTTALEASLRAVGVGEGDEVIVPAYSFNATLNSVLRVGATAVFADIRPEDFNIDPDSTEALVTDRTKAIMPVHLYGQMADMDPLQAIADEHGLAIVEDAAQAHGARYKDASVGSYGIAGFSFYPTKNIAAPEAGIVTTNDDTLAQYVSEWRNQGMGKERYQYTMAEGTNARSNDIAAAFVLPQLKAMPKTMERRRANAKQLQEGLAEVPGIVVPQELEGRKHVWHQFTVRVLSAAGVTRDELVADLQSKGVGVGVYYPRIMRDYPVYDNNSQVGRQAVPQAEQTTREVMSLPVHPYVTENDLQFIVDSIKSAVEGGEHA